MEPSRSHTDTRPAAYRPLTARLWKDILKAQQNVRPGVTIVMHGVTISGDSRGAAPQQQQTRHPPTPPQSTQPPEQSEAPMDTTGSPPSTTTSKKAQRDARRLEDHRSRVRIERWCKLARPFVRTSRRIIRDAVWTAWMRRKIVLRKLRDLFWRAWTTPVDPNVRIHELRCIRHDGKIEDPVLGPTSHRDEFIRSCVYGLCHQDFPGIYAKLKPFPYFNDTDFEVDAEGFDEGDMEAAITASLAESSSPARQPSNRKAGKSKSHEAGVSTPAGANDRRKRNGKGKTTGAA